MCACVSLHNTLFLSAEMRFFVLCVLLGWCASVHAVVCTQATTTLSFNALDRYAQKKVAVTAVVSPASVFQAHVDFFMQPGVQVLDAYAAVSPTKQDLPSRASLITVKRGSIAQFTDWQTLSTRMHGDHLAAELRLPNSGDCSAWKNARTLYVVMFLHVRLADGSLAYLYPDGFPLGVDAAPGTFNLLSVCCV